MEPPKLREGDRKNFETILQAYSDDNLALVSAIRKADQQPVALICAMSAVEGEPGVIRPIPLAVMVEGNPFDIYEDPTTHCRLTGIGNIYLNFMQGETAHDACTEIAQ